MNSITTTALESLTQSNPILLGIIDLSFTSSLIIILALLLSLLIRKRSASIKSIFWKMVFASLLFLPLLQLILPELTILLPVERFTQNQRTVVNTLFAFDWLQWAWLIESKIGFSALRVFSWLYICVCLLLIKN